MYDESGRGASAPARRRAAVIGSGFGGISAAIRLQAAGYSVVTFEARDKPGGRAYVYSKDGFDFDGGPTVITAPHCLEELFACAGRRLESYVDLLPVRPFYRLSWEDGVHLDYDADTEHMLAQIRARRPEDAEGYLRFIEYSKRVFTKGYEELAATPFLRFSDMVRVAPDLAKLRADRSVYATVARFVRDEHVRQALSFHSLLVGGNPFETSSIYTLIHHLERRWGVFFPRGGTGALVNALVRLYRELGGELLLSTPVERVEVLRGSDAGSGTERAVAVHRVHAGGRSFDADVVVSNADLHHTYARLYRDEPAARRTAHKLTRLEWSMSLFVLYFGTDRVYADSPHHNVLFGQRYRELLRDIFHGPGVPDDFSLYLHAPTVTDPSLAPPGCSSFYVLSPVPHLGKAPVDWDELAPRYAQQILAAVERRALPELRKHLVTQHWITPRSFERDLGSWQGSAFSVAPKLTQSAWFRPHNQDPKIPGLYLVGAGTHPGAGLPGVINSAKATVGLILGQSPVESAA